MLAYYKGMQAVSLVVKAKNLVELWTILNKAGINKDSSDKHKKLNGLFVITIKRSEQINSQVYANIRESAEIGILNDSSSQERAEEVFRAIYRVEIQLRRLLLYVSGVVETYYDILLQHGKYTNQSKDTKHDIIFKGSSDVRVSQLTMGELIQIMGYDFSWSSRALTTSDVNELLTDSKDFDEFKSRVDGKSKVTFVWDVVANQVLLKSLPWEKMEKNLIRLKKYRDTAAHHNHFTEKQKVEAVKLAETIEKEVELPATVSLSPAHQAALQNLSKQITDSLRGIQMQYNSEAFRSLAEHRQQIVSNMLKNSSLQSSLERSLASFNTSINITKPTMDAISKNLSASLFEQFKYPIIDTSFLKKNVQPLAGLDTNILGTDKDIEEENSESENEEDSKDGPPIAPKRNH